MRAAPGWMTQVGESPRRTGPAGCLQGLPSSSPLGMRRAQHTATRVMKARPNERFQPLLNPLTGVNVDEWKWYAPNPQMLSRQRKSRLRQELERVVGCHTTLRFSPKLSWSATTEEGKRQIACSVAAVSDALEQLSGNSEEYKYSVESLLLSDSGRSDAVCLKIQKKFVEELFDYMQGR